MRGECSRLEIVHYIGIGRVELARSVRDVVSALGDGERYDFRRFGCHLFDHRLRILWSEQVLDDRPDDPGLEGSVGMLERQRVEAVLRAECVFHSLVRRHHSHSADSPVEALTASQESIDVHGLVCTVKASDTEMHYASGDFAPVVVRHFECSIEVEQGLRIEFHESTSLLRRQ